MRLAYLHGVLVLGLACASTAQAGTMLLSDLTTGGTATGLPANSPAGEPPSSAFDDVRTTKGLIFNTGDVTATAPVIFTYDFAGTTAHTVLSYSLTSANDSPSRDARDFFLEGSNDGNVWVIADTVVNHAFVDQPGFGDQTLPNPVTDQTRFETFFFTVDAPASYQQYRLRIIETFGATDDRPQLAEIQLFNTVVPEPGSLGLLGLGMLGLLARRRR
jgi:hypothetical protein